MSRPAMVPAAVFTHRERVVCRAKGTPPHLKVLITIYRYSINGDGRSFSESNRTVSRGLRCTPSSGLLPIFRAWRRPK